MKDIYVELDSECSTVYYSPNVYSNPYLELLYSTEGLKDYTIKFAKPKEFPALFIKHILNKEQFILHHHWLHANDGKLLMILMFKLLFIIALRIFGCKVLWTIHNEYPHNRKFFRTVMICRRILAWVSSLIHVHGNADINILKDVYKIPETKFRVFKHPMYKVKVVSRQESISYFKEVFDVELDQLKNPLLFFGHISRYKGIIGLVEAFIKTANRDTVLIIAGQFRNKGEDQGLRDEIRTLIKDQSNIVIIPKRIEDDQLSYLFGISEYVIFNFKRILTSGSVIMAKSYGKRVITPNLGNISEYLEEGDFLFNSPDELEEIIRKISVS